MLKITPTEFISILERGEFDNIIGVEESDQIEFKESSYILDGPRQKWELAKDVAAFLNTNGGLLVIGYRTERVKNALVDRVIQHKPVEKGLINWEAYKQILSSWIYPTDNDLTAQWFPDDISIEKAVFVLKIPPQSESKKFFLIKQIDNPDGKFPGAIGIPYRNGDAIEWKRPETIYHLLNCNREANINNQSKKETLHTISFNNKEQFIKKRCTDIENAARWEEVPFFALHAISESPIKRPVDFYNEDGFSRSLENPEILRNRGFHIRTGNKVEIKKDGSLVSSSLRRILWLSPECFFSAGAVADQDFLGWYVSENGPPIIINPHVLVEFTLEFCRFFHQHLKILSQKKWSLWISIVGFDRLQVFLVPELGRRGNSFLLHKENLLPKHTSFNPNMNKMVYSLDSPGKDAYQLIEEFYAFFGFPPDDIPFVENESISKQLLLDYFKK